ncbi:alkaline phosphatase-like protein [Mytilinidion resinicola]|uniref:Alkaline phosphatase-like protein n=1 Tax=Mytilinidion resinicola TaxID=574789 RepID=A0A6A6YD21_9PEZI|nr:alkaline phosphatase-like protein [Mytilinidion resinicola]KAF2805914.1 alkaline phosphatase-like protein [Mytilinidion resinicola]
MSSSTKPKRPNFLVILADDLGFSDIGCFGSEIHTPNIDKYQQLAKSGLRFTDFHAAAACSPSRAMLLTGTDHHIAGLGNLIEWTNISGQNDPSGAMSTAPQRGMPGYEGYLNERVVTLPEILRDGGYATMMAGKWHLGLTPERGPQNRGFEKSFAHLPACSNHYGYEPQLEKEKGDQIPAFMTMSYIALHSEDGEYVKELPEGWYSSDGYGDKLLAYLRDWKEEQAKEERPFFAYLPFTAPHWPLQAPQQYIKKFKKYKGVYDSGPDALRLQRLQRLQRLKDLGLIAPDVEPHPVVAEETKSWAELSPTERAASSRAMEVFAAMVECIDANVGKVVSYLESIGELENTFVTLMSDNGAEGAAYEAYPIVQSTMLGHLKKYYDNSLDNLRNGDSFIWYGPRWAQAATAPSRLYKAYTTEGGVRVPFLAKWPQGVLGKGRGGGVEGQFATIMDLAPTILEMAGLAHPAPLYKGREVVEMRGRSMQPFVSGAAPRIHPEDFVQGWETCGRAACRKGDWKIVFIPKPKGPERWQLYNLKKDPEEVHDLAEQEPERLEKLKGLWDQYVIETGVVPLAPALGKWMQAMEEQMVENAWIEYEYWKDGARDEPEKFFKDILRFQRVVKPM